MMKQLTIIFLIIILPIISFAEIIEVPFTLDDRDRIIKMEERINSLYERINSLEEKIDIKFDALNEKIDRLYTLIYFVLGGMISLFGFVVWDRRTTITPIKHQIKHILDSLIELSKENPKLAEILRTNGLL